MRHVRKDAYREDLAALVKAILTRAREREGYVNKTKLFKYLYLIDIESYRRTGRLLTGFQWIFYYYGPWAKECEDLYSAMREFGGISVKPGSRPDLDVEFVEASEPLDLGDVVKDCSLEYAIRKTVDRWADRSLGEMLDYVYFHTEPMAEAEKGKPLDFSKVERSVQLQPPLQRQQAPDKAAVERMRKAIGEKKAGEQEPATAKFTPPPYDDDYFEALRIMEKDEGY